MPKQTKLTKKEQAKVERWQNFLNEYQALTIKHSVQLVAQITSSPNGIMPTIRLADIVKKEPKVKHEDIA